MTIAEKLEQMNLTLPPAAKPVGSYVPAVRTGKLIVTSGQLPMRDGALIVEGKVPRDVSLEEAAGAARQAVLNALSAVNVEADGLDNVARIVRVNVFVASAPGFTDQAKVANGASDLLVTIFGDSGRHTRCAIGASELPLNSPVELDLLVELK